MSDSSPELVSVIIPAHRAAAYLVQTLASVAAQTHPNWEVLVMEDGVYDETSSIVADFAARGHLVRHFVHPENRGVSHARNRLLDEARGAYVAFLDADDTWQPDHLAHSLALLRDPAVSWVIGGLNLIDPVGRVLKSDVLAPDLPVAAIPATLLAHNFILTSGMVLRTRVFAGGLRFDPTIKVGEDLDLCLRLLREKHLPVRSTRATLNYRKHPSSTTADPVRFSEEFARLFEKHLANPDLPAGHCLRGVVGQLLNVTRMTWRRDPARARSALRRLFMASPWVPRAWFYAALSWPRFR